MMCSERMVAMKNKSWLVFVLVTVIALSACAGGKSSGSPTSGTSPTGEASPIGATAAPAKQIKLDFWYALSGDSGNAVQELVKRFNTSQTGITVVATYQGSYADAMAKIDAAIAGDTVQRGPGRWSPPVGE